MITLVLFFLHGNSTSFTNTLYIIQINKEMHIIDAFLSPNFCLRPFSFGAVFLNVLHRCVMMILLPYRGFLYLQKKENPLF